MKRRFLNVFIAVDQLLYVLVTLGNGMPDETLSSAAYRTEQDGKILGRFFRPVIDFLLLPLESEHCKKAYLTELRRNQFPPLKTMP